MSQTIVTDQYEIVSTAKISNAERVLREMAAEMLRIHFPNLSDFSINKIVNRYVSEPIQHDPQV